MGASLGLVDAVLLAAPVGVHHVEGGEPDEGDGLNYQS